jgi:V8-like Glu-specific endopeptidase
MHNNLVLVSDARVIQYLNTTLAGSSGAPVLNNRWQVVGVHQAGGYVRDEHTGKPVLRNQAVAVKQLFDGFPIADIARQP